MCVCERAGRHESEVKGKQIAAVFLPSVIDCLFDDGDDDVLMVAFVFVTPGVRNQQ